LSLLPLIPTWPEQMFIVPYTVLILGIHSGYITGRFSTIERAYMGGGVAVAGVYYYLTWTYPGLYLPLALISVRR